MGRTAAAAPLFRQGRLKEQLVLVLSQFFQVRFALSGHWTGNRVGPKIPARVSGPLDGSHSTFTKVT